MVKSKRRPFVAFLKKKIMTLNYTKALINHRAQTQRVIEYVFEAGQIFYR